MRKQILCGILCSMLFLLCGCGKTNIVQNNQGQAEENDKDASENQADLQEDEHVNAQIKIGRASCRERVSKSV